MKFVYLLSLLSVLFSFPAQSAFYFQHGLSYDSDTHDKEQTSSTSLRNRFFLGATMGKNGQYIVGQGVNIWSKSEQNSAGSTADEISMLELGPRFQWFMNDDKTFYLSATYNFYAKGEIKTSSTAKVSGSSYLASLGYQFKGNRFFFFGVSLNYHSLAITESVVGQTSTNVSQSYSYIYPAIEYSIRFR